MSTGTIHVQAENIFPIIKKFLYSDQEIFLRELVSNAVDACQKIKTLSSIGEVKGEVDDLLVQVSVDKDKGTLTISDNGIGMTAEEVEKYIAQIAFSGAEEFVQKYKDQASGIIGHFGLGFFSAFMVASKVEVISLSHQEGAKSAHWICEGSPSYEMKEGSRTERGTDIVLHIADDAKEYLEDSKISELLNKYCKFLPVEVQFGTKTQTIPSGEGEDKKEETVEVDNIINNPNPAWTRKPSELEEVDYKSFYRELYPMSFEEPLFNIHLNVDYPFNLTGVLYFPKLKGQIDFQRNKIQLYCNQVYVTDSVEGIVPEFLTLLHGVIDSPDIPLNVSRSYLQSDQNVKKISSHITKKVASKLEDIYKNQREEFEAKWDDIKIFMEYGMITEDKFYEKAVKFFLFKNTDGNAWTWEDYKAKIEANQKDKNDQLVVLYASDAKEQHSYIQAANDKGYDVLVMDSPATSHFIQKLEQQLDKVTFTRVDSDTVDKLIAKDEEIPSKLNDEEKEALKPVIEGAIEKDKFVVQMESLSETDSPMLITEPEFMRRMKEMQAMGGGGLYGALPETFNLVVNVNHPLVGKILAEKDQEKQQSLVKQAADLALLSKGLLKGKELTDFIARNVSALT